MTCGFGGTAVFFAAWPRWSKIGQGRDCIASSRSMSPLIKAFFEERTIGYDAGKSPPIGKPRLD
jgi:cephalosporin hydroxylase